MNGEAISNPAEPVRLGFEHEAYLARAESSEVELALRRQWDSANRHGVVMCGDCGIGRHLTVAFRCLYCGLWFCGPCAEAHFGKSVREHFEERQRRKEREDDGEDTNRTDV